MIKVYNTGVIRHIFEVETEILDTTSHLTRMHYISIPGSLCYIRTNKLFHFDSDPPGRYPVDECRDPTPEEAALYENAKGI